MTSRAVSKFLGGAGICVLALTAPFAGCHDQSVTSSDDPTCSRDADCSSLGVEFGCDAGHCRHGSFASGGGAGGGGDGGAGAPEVVAGTAGAAPLGACHSEPDLTPSFPAPTALDPDFVARAAAVIGSCMPDDGVARSAAHLWLEHLAAPRLYFRLGEQLECLANASCGCAAVEHCLGWVYRVPPAVCPSGCQGQVFTGCGDGAQITMDCSRFGLSCDRAADCVAEAAVACDGSEAPTCTAQGEALFCDDGFMQKTPCQALGFSCVAGKCVGNGTDCTDSDSTSGELEQVLPIGTACTGGKLSACLGGKTTSVDCATQGPGFSCQSFNGAFFCGLAAECVPAGNYSSPEPATCDGTTLGFCNAGRLEHLDCTTLGFSGCEIDTSQTRYGCIPGALAQ
ncbi:MAG: hypothetical protein WDO69_29720 [Pseudomonadota bacterium]